MKYDDTFGLPCPHCKVGRAVERGNMMENLCSTCFDAICVECGERVGERECCTGDAVCSECRAPSSLEVELGPDELNAYQARILSPYYTLRDIEAHDGWYVASINCWSASVSHL